MSEILIPKLQVSDLLAALKESLNSTNPEQVLPHIFSLTSLLRQDLSAREYYKLFLQILDGLLEFSYYLSSVSLTPDLLSKAQYSIEIVPRLYTTIVVGAKLYEQQLSIDTLDDLIELVKGVQHPLRGLFLRYFLIKLVKNLLKENSIEHIEFILKNLSVMNTMWGRIEDLEQREALKITVGENIVRLSVICSDQNVYFEKVFPRIMEILKNSDLISQQYLLDCMIQAFPDDFLLIAFNEFIELACQIQTVRDVVSLIYHSLDRVLRYTLENSQSLNEISFIPLHKYLGCVINSDKKNNFRKKIEVHGIVLKFSGSDKHKIENMVNCLENLYELLENNEASIDVSDVVLEILVDSIGINFVKATSLRSFSRGFKELSEKQKTQLAWLINEKLELEDQIENLEFWVQCCDYLKFVYVSDEGMKGRISIIKIIKKHIWNFEFMQVAFDTFCDEEIIVVFICFTCLEKLNSSISFKKLVKPCIEKIQTTYLAFQICMCCIISFVKTGILEDLPYFMQKGVRLYENILNHSCKNTALFSLIQAAIHMQSSFGFAEQVSQLCYKIPKKSEQCTMLLSLSHVFWSDNDKNSSKLIEVLKRSVKLADLCVAGSKNIFLFVMILNQYIFFKMLDAPTIDVLSINSLIELIFELLAINSEESSDLLNTKKYFLNTIEFINKRQVERRLQEVVYNYDYKNILL